MLASLLADLWRRRRTAGNLCLGLAMLTGLWAFYTRIDDDNEIPTYMAVDVTVGAALAVAIATLTDPPPETSHAWWWFVRLIWPLCVFVAVTTALILFHRVVWAIRMAPPRPPPAASVPG